MALNSLPLDVERTAIAIAYKNPNYIFREVLPEFPVGKESFTYTRYSRQDAFTVPDTTIGRTGQLNEVEFHGELVDAHVVDQGLTAFVTSRERSDAPPGSDPIGRKTQRATELIELAREKRAADLVFGPDTYPAGNKEVLSGADQFSDPSSDPVAKINGILDAMLVRPNIAVMGPSVLARLKTHPKIIQAIYPGAAGGLITTEQIAALFELDAVIVGRGWINSAPKKKGGQIATTRLWGNHLALIYRSPNFTSGDDMTFGGTAYYGQRVVRTGENTRRGLRGVTEIVVGETLREVILAPDLGYLIQDAVA